MTSTITIHATFGKPILKEIAIDHLHSGIYQPRESFSFDTIASLSKTIEQLGVLEPLIVRPSSKHPGHYEIVAGERRWRAAKQAGLTAVPCLLASYSNEQAAQIALIENTCREALDPIAEALAMQRLATEFQYTHEEVALLLGMNRVNVTQQLRLLKLDYRIQHWLKLGDISVGHGKVLAGLPLEEQYNFAYDAIKKGWTVRTLEEAITAAENHNTPLKRQRKMTTPLSPLEQQLAEQFGHPVKLTLNKNESGYFRIPFHDSEHMQKILGRLCAATDG